VFIFGIPYVLDCCRQFISFVYAIFFHTHQRIPISLGSTEEILAYVLSQNTTLQGYLRDRLDLVQESPSVTMDELDNGMNMAISMRRAFCSMITN
jgi:hypothetical protein